MIEAALVLTGLTRRWTDFAIIGALLLLNGGVGFWQEHQAKGAIQALQQRLAKRAGGKRDGAWTTLPAEELIRGDLATVFGRTAELARRQPPPSHFQQAVISIGKYLIAVALVLVAVIVGVSLLRGTGVTATLEFALVVTIASVPGDNAGLGSAITGSGRQVGAALGIGVLGALTNMQCRPRGLGWTDNRGPVRPGWAASPPGVCGVLVSDLVDALGELPAVAGAPVAIVVDSVVQLRTAIAGSPEL